MGSSDSIVASVPDRLILFDGVCNLCNGSVQFIIKRDPQGKFYFASLQSDYAREILARFPTVSPFMESIILIKHGQVFEKSAALLEIAADLSGAWPLLYGFKIIPAFLRDYLYKWVSARRYKFFGKIDSCMIPTAALRARFVSN